MSYHPESRAFSPADGVFQQSLLVCGVAIEKNGETPLHIFVDIADNSFKFIFQERK
jgi:hypothetical protein